MYTPGHPVSLHPSTHPEVHLNEGRVTTARGEKERNSVPDPLQQLRPGVHWGGEENPKSTHD